MRYSIIGSTVEQVQSAGGREIKEARSTGILFARLEPDQVDQLRSLGAKVKPVSNVKPTVETPLPIHAEPVFTPADYLMLAELEEIRQLTDPPLYGDGQRLAIIDSGIRATHEAIGGRVIYAKNFTAGPDGDNFDHGTGVASAALVVAPKAGILDLKVLDDAGYGTEEEVVLGIEECIDLHDTNPDIAPSVINISLGSPDDGDPDNALRLACRAAIEKEIWVVAAAGNTGPEAQTVMLPASEQYVGAVGSVQYIPDEQTFVVSAFSGRGPTKEGLVKPDMVFFGENMIVASSASDTATAPKSGTSFAAPFAAAMPLLYFESREVWAEYDEEDFPGAYPRGAIGRTLTPQEFIDQFLGAMCIKPQGAPRTKDYDYGHGLPFGPLVKQALAPVPAIAGIVEIVTPIMMLGMMGMMMGTMTKALK